jgi:hypothetical protein
MIRLMLNLPYLREKFPCYLLNSGIGRHQNRRHGEKKNLFPSWKSSTGCSTSHFTDIVITAHRTVILY